MNHIETMKLALEALEDACGGRCNAEYNPCFQREAITALRQALEQAEPDYKALWQQMCERCDALDKQLALREWAWLTDEDCEEVERWVEFKEEGSGRIPTGKLIRYIEFKLKEKNT